MITRKKKTHPKSKVLIIIHYLGLIALSALTFAGMCIFNADGVWAFLLTMLCIYVFVGSIIKLCLISEKAKDTVLYTLDMLFFLP